MDKYIQQIQKTKLWAHRRNTTAQKQLNGRIKLLEQDYERNCRQYLRNRIRIQSELNELETLPSCEENDEIDITTERINNRTATNFSVTSNISTIHGVNSTKKVQTNGSYRKNVTSPKTIAIQSPTHLPTPTHTSTSISAQVSSNLSVPKSLDAVDVDVTDVNYRNIRTPHADSYTSLRQDLTRETSDVSTTSGRTMTRASATCSDTGYLKTTDISMGAGTRSSLMGKSSDIVCKYIETRSTVHDCSYFPCRVPVTYHTLGYRREDLCTWTGDASTLHSDVTTSPCPVDTPVHQRILSNGNKVYLETCSDARDMLYSSEQVPALRGTVYPVWCKNKSLKPFKFQETEGPLFTSKPPDPILDQIRNGGDVKPLDEARCTTRTTVRAKIRGLKQLVTEMRARNELTRPVDWAVNYGAKMPTRLLMNPVFPVGNG